MSVAQDFYPRKDRYGKPRFYVSPGQPRKNEMKLAVWLDENETDGKTRDWLASELKVLPTTVDRWCNGTRRPQLETILDIQKLTDGAVTPEDWKKSK